MPTVLRAGGFRVVILLPPRKHGPPHVHVRSVDGEAVIELATADGMQTLRTVSGMRTSDATAAFSIVQEHADYLRQCWRKHHG